MITAAELRAMGVPLDESIPDCAWVPRLSIRWVVGKPTASDPRTLLVPIEAEFTQPFTWIEGEGTIET